MKALKHTKSVLHNMGTCGCITTFKCFFLACLFCASPLRSPQTNKVYVLIHKSLTSRSWSSIILQRGHKTRILALQYIAMCTLWKCLHFTKKCCFLHVLHLYQKRDLLKPFSALHRINKHLFLAMTYISWWLLLIDSMQGHLRSSIASKKCRVCLQALLPSLLLPTPPPLPRACYAGYSNFKQ